MKKLVIGCAAAVLILLGAFPARAAGFSVFEQSAKASGQAGAWVARADDAAANWYNPAALVRLDGTQFQFGLNSIDIGSDTTFTINDSTFVGANPFNGGTTAAPGTVYEHESNNVLPAHLYFSQRLNDRWAVGVGLTTPFGLVSEWSDAPLTYSSERAEFMTFVINPNIAFMVGDNAALAFGLDYIYADVKEFSRSVPVQADPGTVAFEAVGRSNLTGNGGDLGWNAAWHYAAPEWAMGLSYRSALNPEIEGAVEFSGFGDYQPLFQNSPAKTTINLPSTAAVGLAFTGLESVQFEIDLTWMQWSRFRTLVVDIRDNQGLVSDIVLNEDWKDGFAVRVGADWAVADAHHVRFGLLRDQNPIPTQTLRPSIPDADRTGYTLGYGFNGERFQVDAYWMHLNFDDRVASGVFTSATPGPNDGVIDGTYRSSVDLFGITAGIKF